MRLPGPLLLLLAAASAAPAGADAAPAPGPATCLPAPNGSPDGCRVALDPARERELALVQAAVNAAIRPASDLEAFGVAERWAPVEADPGDCDDYALAKLHRLLALGWPRAALRLTMAALPDGEDHLVLAVRTDRGDYVFDNLRQAPVPWAALPYRWLGQEVPSRGVWRAVVTTAGAGGGAGT